MIRCQDPGSHHVDILQNRWSDDKIYMISSCQHPSKQIIRWQDLGSHHVDILQNRWSDDKIYDLIMSTSFRKDDQMTRSRISSCRHPLEEMIRWQDPGSHHVDILQNRWSDDKIPDLIMSISFRTDDQMTRSTITSCRHPSGQMTRWQDPRSHHVEIWCLKPNMRARRARAHACNNALALAHGTALCMPGQDWAITSLRLGKISTWWDPRSCHLIICSKGCGHEVNRDLVILLSLLNDVDMMRS